MTNIKIVPIFDQSQPNIWTDFLRIRAATMRENYNIEMSPTETADALNEYQSAWSRRAFNFAFGAYRGREMIGFVNGDCMSSVATIRGLYVLPEYQSQHIGSALLKSAESVSAFGAKNLDLVALGNGVGFYDKFGYSPINLYGGATNHYVKKINSANKCVVLPVFHITKLIGNACDKIAADNKTNFKGRLSDFHNSPIFIYLDYQSNITGFALGTQRIEQMHVALHTSKEIAFRRFGTEFENLRNINLQNTK